MIYLIFFFLEITALNFFSKIFISLLFNLIFSFTKNKTFAVNAISFIFLPGIVVHEFSHLLFASLLFIPVGKMDFSPKIEEEGIKLGTLQIGKAGIFRRILIGFAPVLFGLTIISAFYFYLYPLLYSNFKTPFLADAFIFYMVFVVGNTMFSSRRDLEGFLETALFVLVLAISFYILGFRIPHGVFEIIEKSVDIMKRLNLILLTPLVTDAIFIGVIKLLTGVKTK